MALLTPPTGGAVRTVLHAVFAPETHFGACASVFTFLECKTTKFRKMGKVGPLGSHKQT